MICIKFKKLEIGDNPHVGVYASVSNEYGLFPNVLTKEQEKDIVEALDINIVRINLGQSTINGAISKLYKNKVVLTDSSSKIDQKYLESQGLEVLKISGYHAVGNLILVNDKGLVLSSEFSKKHVEDISEFFGLKSNVMNLGGISVVGAMASLNNKNIAVCPHITKEEFSALTKIFKVKGNIATVNYGDPYVANGLLINDKGVVMGSLTSGYEIIRIDDIFG